MRSGKVGASKERLCEVRIHTRARDQRVKGMPAIAREGLRASPASISASSRDKSSAICTSSRSSAARRAWPKDRRHPATPRLRATAANDRAPSTTARRASPPRPRGARGAFGRVRNGGELARDDRGGVVVDHGQEPACERLKGGDQGCRGGPPRRRGRSAPAGSRGADRADRRESARRPERSDSAEPDIRNPSTAWGKGSRRLSFCA